jgi:hypothetical protein
MARGARRSQEQARPDGQPVPDGVPDGQDRSPSGRDLRHSSHGPPAGDAWSMQMAPPRPATHRGRNDDEPQAGLPTITLELPDGSISSRRRALSRLDDLLDQLEQTNLREETSPPERALDELRELGLAEPESYSPTDLIEIVFGAQRPLLKPAITWVPAEREPAMRQPRSMFERPTEEAPARGRIREWWVPEWR